MSEYEIRDLVRYLHNVRKKDGSANPIIGEDELGVVAALAYLLEDNNFVMPVFTLKLQEMISKVSGVKPENFQTYFEEDLGQ